MKVRNLILTVILVVMGLAGKGQGMLYTFSKSVAEVYGAVGTKGAGMTTVQKGGAFLFVNNDLVCVFNDEFAWCDNALDYHISEAVYLDADGDGMKDKCFSMLITTDVTEYSLMFVDSSLETTEFYTQNGDRVFLYDQISTKKVSWSPVMTRSGWSLTAATR